MEREMTDIRAGVAVSPGGWERWMALTLEALGEAGIAVDAGAACPAGTIGLARPWRTLLALERFMAGSGRDPLSRIEPARAVPLAEARPDILVLPPGCPVTPGLLERVPLGVLQMEPVHAARLGRGVLEGRLLWHRSGSPARLAAATATCAPGPFPGSFVRAHLAKAALMPARVLARYRMSGDAFRESLPEAEPLPSGSPHSDGPAAWGGFLLTLAGHGLKKAWQDLLHRRQWHLAIRPGDGDPRRPGFRTQAFSPLVAPGRTGWADPFLVGRHGRTWLFVEEIPYRKKGVISVMEVLPNGGFGEPRRVLEEPFHLSYPNVFEFEGNMYMVPETAQASQVRLYRATDFPWRWELDRVLLDGVPATDATLLEHGGCWWMFVNLRPEGGSSWDELHLFRSATLMGPYLEHPLNPVVSDVRRARPAGRIIRKDGRLFRPAQDCSGWYGRALAMMEITRLDETGYEEREAARLEPGLIPGSFCLHTFEAGEGMEIADGQRLVPVWR